MIFLCSFLAIELTLILSLSMYIAGRREPRPIWIRSDVLVGIIANVALSLLFGGIVGIIATIMEWADTGVVVEHGVIIAVSIGLTLLSLLVLVTNVLAQGNTQLKVDGDRIKSYVAYLSTDEFRGRQSMTPEYQAAAEWVAAQYEAWGFEPAGDDGTYFQRVPIGRSLMYYYGVPEMAMSIRSPHATVISLVPPSGRCSVKLLSSLGYKAKVIKPSLSASPKPV